MFSSCIPVADEEIYDDVPPEFSHSSSGASKSKDAQTKAPEVDASLADDKPMQPQDYTVLHFESKKDSSKDTTVINSTPLIPVHGQPATHTPPPPPVPPHAVDHSTYEPVSPQEESANNISVDSGYEVLERYLNLTYFLWVFKKKRAFLIILGIIVRIQIWVKTLHFPSGPTNVVAATAIFATSNISL